MLLLDEPLSALDLKLRQHMRNELRAIQQRVGITFIYITHDQGEALTMSDRIAVMREGVIEQIADGRRVYDDPATAFVASFVGENNPFSGKVVSTAGERHAGRHVERARCGPDRAAAARGGLKPGDEAMVFVRPESLRSPMARAPAQARTSSPAESSGEEFEGPIYHLFVGTGRRARPIKVSLVNQGAMRGRPSVATR